MKRKLEIQMIEPVSSLMYNHMGLEIITKEFSAGYGIADLVGGLKCKDNYIIRKKNGFSDPIDQHQIIEVLLILKPGIKRSINYISKRISFSESTLQKKILPKMSSQGLIKREINNFVRLLFEPPYPMKRIVAIELKQTKWREAIIQARRYTFFANQTYIAVWNGTASHVSHSLLKKHKIGLIGVENNSALILYEAPYRKPRNSKMNRFCAEFLYKKSLSS